MEKRHPYTQNKASASCTHEFRGIRSNALQSILYALQWFISENFQIFGD